MSKFTLIIGNKNYSSWSLRPWLVMKHTGIAFDEIRIPLYQPGSDQQIEKYSPSGRVPALKYGDVTVWDSLAICEYLNELYPEKRLWPEDQTTRAQARAISAEMHSGFSALRTQMPMNCRERFPGKGQTPEVDADIARIQEIWQDRRNQHKNEGAFLFGKFSIADAMYAPVAIRFHCYDVKLDNSCEDYRQTILDLPAMKEWMHAGTQEPERLELFEPYRL
jgi:glutathione S-transferase